MRVRPSHCHESRLHFPWVAEGDRDQSGSALIKITDRLRSLPQDLIEVKPSHDIIDLKDDPNSTVHRFFLFLFLSTCKPPSPTPQPPSPPCTLARCLLKNTMFMKRVWMSSRTPCWLRLDWSASPVMAAKSSSRMMNLHQWGLESWFWLSKVD